MIRTSFILTQENTGVIIVKTNLYLVVATYTEGMYPSVCVEATEKLGKFAFVPCGSGVFWLRLRPNELGQKVGTDWKDTEDIYRTTGRMESS